MKSRKSKDALIKFIRNTVSAAGFKKVILGVSGGVDSAVVAHLSVSALGRSNVIAATLPYNDMDPDGARFASTVIRKLGIRSYNINIAPMVDAYFKNFPGADIVRRGNKMARERMAVLYDLSKKENALVIGCGNKTEILLGYCTLYGDTACALNPLAVLYKTEVYKLAKELGVPEGIIKRKPTAGLWKSQTDEGELGYLYAEIDSLLSLLTGAKKPGMELERKGFDKKFISDITARLRNAEFKRKPAAVPFKDGGVLR